MAGQTTNLHLKKPEYSESSDVAVLNENMDTIDAAVKALQDDKIDKTSIVNTLEETSEGNVLDARQGKALDDKKIDKTNIANTLTETDEGKVLDARQGKALDEKKVNWATNESQGKFLQTNENGEAVWGDPFSDAAVATAVDAWMNEHAGAGSFTLDDTLTGATSAAQAKAAGDGIKAALANEAPVFNASSTYKAGQYVTYGGVLYRLTADHAADVTWASTSKVASNLGGEVTDLKSALGEHSEVYETFVVQAVEFEFDVSDPRNGITVTFRTANTDVIGYFLSNRGTLVVKADEYGEAIASHKFRFTIPRYYALVFTINAVGGLQARTKGQEQITKDDIILLGNYWAGDDALDNFVGILWDKYSKVITRKNESNIAENCLKGITESGYISSLSAYTTDGTNDADKIKSNLMIGLLNSTAANLPTSPFNGQIIQFNTLYGINYSKIQIAITGGVLYFRNNFSTNGAWNSWDIANIKLAGKSSYISTLNNFTTDGTNDADKLKPYVMVGLISATNTLNLPEGQTNGYLISISSTENETYGNIQFFIVGNTAIYMRTNYSYSGSWTEWRNIIEYYTTVDYTKTFRNVAVIGDSITAGTMPKFDGSYVTNFDYSWPSLLFTNATIQNCARSGSTAKTFFTDSEMSQKLQNLNNKTEAVFIYLGANSIEGVSMGTEEDIVTNWDDTPTETNYGWYSKLYKAVRHYTNEYCPIIVINCPDISSFTEMNEMFSDCAEACGCLYADRNAFPSNKLDYILGNNNDGTHFTSAGYAGLAEAFKWAINDVVKKNSTAFNKTALILDLE